jgi:hypothetical protein
MVHFVQAAGNRTSNQHIFLKNKICYKKKGIIKHKLQLRQNIFTKLIYTHRTVHLYHTSQIYRAVPSSHERGNRYFISIFFAIKSNDHLLRSLAEYRAGIGYLRFVHSMVFFFLAVQIALRTRTFLLKMKCYENKKLYS